MLLQTLWLAGLAAAQSSQSIITLHPSASVTGADAAPFVSLPGSPIGSGRISTSLSSTPSLNASASTSQTSKAADPLTSIVGGNRTTTASGNITASGTTTTARPTNTQPCNNYKEFCTRKYSNITEVCAHNSPFDRKNNVASNQQFGVTQQLNDGIRMLQGQTHFVNNTLFYCHTSCDLLNAGTVESYLSEVTAWVRDHPFDVITILLGNGDYTMKDSKGNPLVTSQNFVVPITNAGLLPYIYQPPKTAMTLEDWPTLSELIVSNKRVVMFIDYNFDTDAVPYILWEFYNMWETPYSPTDVNFPCTISRPDGLASDAAKDLLYMANHNLNVKVSIAGSDLLIPNSVGLNVTNGLNGTGSLGLMSNSCTSDWGRPPNFLLVDYYNVGSFNGSVFEVAARANNVTYDRKCCGVASLASEIEPPSKVLMGLFGILLFGFLL